MSDRPVAASYRQVLATRNVAPLLVSASLSRLASEMLLFTTVLYVLATFGSPVLAGWSGFFGAVPGFLISPIAGAVLDRIGAVRAVVVDVVLSGVLIGLVVVASVRDRLTPALLLTLLAAYSLTSPLSVGGIRALLPRFVPESAYDKANALDLSTYSVIEVLSPLAGGGLIALAGPDPAMGVVAALFVLAAVSLLGLRGSPPDPGRGEPGHLLRSAWDGITYLFGHATLRGLAVSYSCYQVAFGILVITVPVTVAERAADLGRVDVLAGLMWSVVGVCAAAGALAAGRVLGAGRERHVLIGATALSALSMFPVSALGSLIALVVGLVGVGVCEGGVSVSVLSLRQRRTDPRWLGRVMTVSISVNLIGFPLGSALGGVLVVESTGLAFAVAAGFALLAALTGALVIPAGRAAPGAP